MHAEGMKEREFVHRKTLCVYYIQGHQRTNEHQNL